MISRIQKVAVIGSGVMGSGIAAHLANIGIPSVLLDIVPTELTAQEDAKGFTLGSSAVRNRYASSAIQALKKQKPAPLSRVQNADLITPGNLQDHAHWLADCDWIIEVVVEKLAVKKQVLSLIEQHRKTGSIVSSNTSGISIEAMVEGREESFSEHFLGTHFFNPPRYLKLLEIIPTSKTNPKVVAFMKQFGEDILGKGVVLAKDTPNFIANRIGTYGLLRTVKEMMEADLTVGEIDSLTGPLLGRPKSATFRTLDVVGLDTFIHVAQNVVDQVDGDEKLAFTVPAFMATMRDNGWLGSKTTQGFYKKEGKEIVALNPKTLQYEPRKKFLSKGIALVQQEKGTANKLKALVQANDPAGYIVWKLLAPVLSYAATLCYDIADDITSIDEAMKWGFGWEYGPFETWDILGVEGTVRRMMEDGYDVPEWVHELLANGYTSFYSENDEGKFYYHHGELHPVVRNEKHISIKELKKQGKVIKKNSGASLLDMGDGVALLEFHSPNNAIGLDIIQMITAAVDEVEENFKGLVIGNEGKNFCVGANLAMILMEAQDDNYYEVEYVLKQFQQAMMKIKYSKRPVVVAPFGMTLGGGTEICLPAAKIQASYETYMGLVEVGVGLIPGGGGNKELYINRLNSLPQGIKVDLQELANSVFETVAMAKVTTSGHGAFDLGFLELGDSVSVNKDHLLFDAKESVLALDKAGYQPPLQKKIPVVGESGYATLLLGAKNMHLSGYISDYDLEIAKELAYVIAGGKVPFGTEVDEEYLLTIEREAFLRLVAKQKSQQRMQHMLVKGKPLRN